MNMRFRYYVLISAALFFVGLALGLFVPGTASEYLSGDVSALQRLAALLGPFSLKTAAFIFAKNLTSLVISFLFAPLLLLVPLTVLTINGALLTFVAVAAAQQRSLAFVLTAILPHGIIELPAVIIGEAAALAFGVSVIRAVLSVESRHSLGADIIQQLKVLALACAMLVPAALIEAFITPLLVTG